MPVNQTDGVASSVAQRAAQNAVLPSQQVQQFKNTTVSGVLNNQTPLTNQQGQTQQGPNNVTAALDQQQAAVTNNTPHNTLLSLYAQTKANKDAAANAGATVKATGAETGTSGTNNYATGGGLDASYNKTYNTNNGLSVARNQALATATSYLGTPYKLGGASHNAIDCSGLVMAVYGQMGLNVGSHNARIQGQVMGQRTSVSNLRPGDLVAWNDGSHIAIYAGNGYIIEAANPRVGTVKRKLWSNAVYGVRLQLPGE